jgi:hypothetical protein
MSTNGGKGQGHSYGRVDTAAGGPRERTSSPTALGAVGGAAGGGSHNGSGNDSLVLISRVPTKRRDKEYSIAFACLLFVMFVISLFATPGDFSASFISYGQAGSWVSMVMIATMLGTFLGMLLSVCVYFADVREPLMEYAIGVTVVLQIIIASIIFVADKWLFLAVLCLFSAVVDIIKFRKAKRYMTISSELVQMAIDVNFRFGVSIVVFVICVGATQCCVLLWWSASFVRLMSEELTTGMLIVGCLFIFCFYWIVQFFHCLVSCVVSGCLLWYFCDAENSMDSSAASAAAGASKHVVLYTQCALTSSLGSLCKAALYSPASHTVISLLHWCREVDPFGGPIHSTLRGAVATVLRPFEPFALRYNRLSMGYVAIYGYTMRRAADAVNREDINAIILEDTTSYTLKTMAKNAGAVVAVLMAIIGSREEGSAWPLFMFVCFLLAYAGVSLSLHSFRSAVDALIIAYSDSPHKFEDMNTIVFHRFFRTTELPM